MKRTVTTVLGAALAAVPSSAGWASAEHATASKTVAHTYKGPSEDMRWGPVQATVTIKGKKITKVAISTSPENDRSTFIDQQAVPMLKQETLQTQSANIDEVSGATMTSDAYIASLQRALKKAHFKSGS